MANKPTLSATRKSGMRYHMLLATLGLVMILPFVWMVLTGLKPLSEVASEDSHSKVQK